MIYLTPIIGTVLILMMLAILVKVNKLADFYWDVKANIEDAQILLGKIWKVLDSAEDNSISLKKEIKELKELLIGNSGKQFLSKKEIYNLNVNSDQTIDQFVGYEKIKTKQRMSKSEDDLKKVVDWVR